MKSLSSTAIFAVILADLPSFSASRAFFTGQNEAMAEMVAQGGVGKTRPIAKGEHFSTAQRLGDGNGGIVADHRAGKHREELDPEIGAAMAQQIGRDNAAS